MNVAADIDRETSYTYAYAATGDANPDAATQVGNTTLTYDNNGNQTAGLGGLEASWDWRNRMNSSTVNSTSSTAYAYDENDKRTRIGTNSGSFHYPNDFYSLDTAQNIPTRRQAQMVARIVYMRPMPIGPWMS